MPPPPFSDLPAEIHLLIANHGTPNNLLSLIRTCSKLHDRCLALLWQDVDLSIHHEPDYALAMHEIQEFYWYNKVVFKGREEDREDALKLTKRPDMVRKIPCLDAVGEKPELAARVRSLKVSSFSSFASLRVKQDRTPTARPCLRCGGILEQLQRLTCR